MPVYRTVEQCTVMRDKWADQALQWLEALEEEGASYIHRYWRHFEECIHKIWEWNGRIEAQKFRDDRLEGRPGMGNVLRCLTHGPNDTSTD